jgi:hypothetical protein
VAASLRGDVRRLLPALPDTVEKTATNDITIPGPKSSLDGIDHNEDVVFVWLNPVRSMSDAWSAARALPRPASGRPSC